MSFISLILSIFNANFHVYYFVALYWAGEKVPPMPFSSPKTMYISWGRLHHNNTLREVCFGGHFRQPLPRNPHFATADKPTHSLRKDCALFLPRSCLPPDFSMNEVFDERSQVTSVLRSSFYSNDLSYLCSN